MSKYTHGYSKAKAQSKWEKRHHHTTVQAYLDYSATRAKRIRKAANKKVTRTLKAVSA